MSGSGRTDDTSSDSDSSRDSITEKGIVFALDKVRTKEFRFIMIGRVKKDNLKDLRSGFRPTFQSKSFDLTCPKLDRQMRRRLKRLNSIDTKNALSKEGFWPALNTKFWTLLILVSFEWILVTVFIILGFA